MTAIHHTPPGPLLLVGHTRDIDVQKARSMKKQIPNVAAWQWPMALAMLIALPPVGIIWICVIGTLGTIEGLGLAETDTSKHAKLRVPVGDGPPLWLASPHGWCFFQQSIVWLILMTPLPALLFGSGAPWGVGLLLAGFFSAIAFGIHQHLWRPEDPTVFSRSRMKAAYKSHIAALGFVVGLAFLGTIAFGLYSLVTVFSAQPNWFVVKTVFTGTPLSVAEPKTTVFLGRVPGHDGQWGASHVQATVNGDDVPATAVGASGWGTISRRKGELPSSDASAKVLVNLSGFVNTHEAMHQEIDLHVEMDVEYPYISSRRTYSVGEKHLSAESRIRFVSQEEAEWIFATQGCLAASLWCVLCTIPMLTFAAADRLLPGTPADASLTSIETGSGSGPGAGGLTGHSEVFSVDIPDREQTRELVLQTLRSLSWKVDDTSPDPITALVKFNLYSVGETVEIAFLPDQKISISSRCMMRTQMFDWGKNRRNVANFISEFQTNVTVTLATGDTG